MKNIIVARALVVTIGCTIFTASLFFRDPLYALNLAARRLGETSPSVFVMKRAFGVGEASPTTLVSGYMDNPWTCAEMIKDHYEKYPQSFDTAFIFNMLRVCAPNSLVQATFPHLSQHASTPHLARFWAITH